MFGLLQHSDAKISNAGNKMLLLRIVGKVGKATIFFLKGKCEKYEKEMFRYENKVVRITGRCKEGTIFGETIECLDVTKNSYFFLCDTEEKYKLLLDNLNNSPGMEELNIFLYYAGKNTNESPIKRLPVPHMVRKNVSRQLLLKLNANREN